MFRLQSCTEQIVFIAMLPTHIGSYVDVYVNGVLLGTFILFLHLSFSYILIYNTHAMSDDMKLY